MMLTRRVWRFPVPPPTVNSLAPFDVTVTFTEAVNGFDAGDVSVTNGAAGAPGRGG